jgi:hypothetical protein
MKKSRDLFFSFGPNIYPIDCHVAFTDDNQKALKYFQKATKTPALEVIPRINSAARVSVFKSHILFEFQHAKGHSKESWAALVAHEACHATWFAEQIIGDLFDCNITEPQCYLIQFITQEILERLWNDS